MPRQLRKIQAFLELPRHFQKCQISSNAWYMYTSNPGLGSVRVIKSLY